MLCIITCLNYVFSKLMFFLFFIGNFDIFYCSNYFILFFYYCRFYLFCTTISSKLHQHPISSRLTLSVEQSSLPASTSRMSSCRISMSMIWHTHLMMYKKLKTQYPKSRRCWHRGRSA